MSHIKRENLVVTSNRHSQETSNYNIYIRSRWIPRSTKKAVPEADRLPQASNCFLSSRNAEKKKIWQKSGWTTRTKALALKQKTERRLRTVTKHTVMETEGDVADNVWNRTPWIIEDPTYASALTDCNITATKLLTRGTALWENSTECQGMTSYSLFYL